LDKINWDYLSSNPNAIYLLEQNKDKINWHWLSENPNAIHLLEQNKNKINWTFFSQNLAIFTYDYDKIKTDRKQINREIIEYVYHPKRLFKHRNFY